MKPLLRTSRLPRYSPCVPLPDCGGTFTALKPGMISIRGSPDKPRDCTWVSKPTSPAFAGLVMLIRFAYFDVPCNHGKVVLHDRVSGAKNELCGADLPPEYTIRASSQLLVTVSLKAGIDVAGVDINYKAETFGESTGRWSQHKEDTLETGVALF